MRPAIRKNAFWLCLLLAYGLYAGLFICRTSHEIGGERYFSLFDDAMVSMRYGANLAHGHGLVWNPGGERTEGYSNPLWVLFMALFHLLPVGPAKISLFIQISAAVFLLANLFFVRQIARAISPGAPLAEVAALLLCAFYLPLNNWALQGMEVGLLTLMISAGVWLAWRGLESGKVNPALYLLLGIGTLVRLDMVVPYLAMLLFLLVSDRKNRLRHAVYGFSILAVFLAGQTAWRWLYYGAVLPNTYYLKMTGYPILLRVSRGFFSFVDFALGTNLPLLLLSFWAVRVRRDRRITLLLTVFLAQIAYSIYVGGDAWEWWGGSNRYLAIAMPLLFVLTGLGLERLRAAWAARRRQGNVWSGPAARRGGTVLTAFLLALVVMAVNTSGDPDFFKAWLLVSTPLHVSGNKAAIEMGQLVCRLTRKEASVAVVWAGTAPYFMERRAIDLLGKCDRVIARERMHLPLPGTNALTHYYPGHLKYDYAYSIGRLQPDVVAQLWGDQKTAQPYLRDAYEKAVLSGFTLFLRKNSPHIRWAEVRREARRPRERLNRPNQES